MTERQSRSLYYGDHLGKIRQVVVPCASRRPLVSVTRPSAPSCPRHHPSDPRRAPAARPDGRKKARALTSAAALGRRGRVPTTPQGPHQQVIDIKKRKKEKELRLGPSAMRQREQIW